jgi:hypothetical protein
MLAIFTMSVGFAIVVLVVLMKAHEPGYTGRCKNRDERSARERKEIRRLSRLSLVPEFDEVVRSGGLALLPGKRFVILDFTMPSSLRLADL